MSVVRVDGGMTKNEWLMQFLADVIDVQVDRPIERETTALGAAMLALMQSDASITLEDLAERWQCDASYLLLWMVQSDTNWFPAGIWR